MDTFRPLRAVFDDLAGSQDRDVAEMLREAGHGDLPDGLLADALTSYADTASVEVAEQLAPFVTAHTGGFAVDMAEGLELLSGAATDDLDVDQLAVAATETTEAPAEALDLSFGIGTEAGELDEVGSADLAADAGLFAGDVPVAAESFAEEAQTDELPESFGEGAGVAEVPDFDDPGEG